MKLLLDTHTFIWWDSAPAKLSVRALALCGDQANQLILSVASLWEIQIKWQLGKLDLRLPLAEIVAHQQETNGLAILPIIRAHVWALEALPSHHRDPFDRLLVAQAVVEEAVLVSGDPVLKSHRAVLLFVQSSSREARRQRLPGAEPPRHRPAPPVDTRGPPCSSLPSAA